jgi:hypothetical protein
MTAGGGIFSVPLIAEDVRLMAKARPSGWG